MSDDTAGKYVCTGGFIISGMIIGSAYGATAGAAAGGAPSVPGVVIGALGGALWAAAICTRPAVKRFFQTPVNRFSNDLHKAMDVGSLRPELRSFIEKSAPDMASKPGAAVAFMLEYAGKHRTEIFNIAADQRATTIAVIPAKAKHGMELLKTAQPLA